MTDTNGVVDEPKENGIISEEADKDKKTVELANSIADDKKEGGSEKTEEPEVATVKEEEKEETPAVVGKDAAKEEKPEVEEATKKSEDVDVKEHEEKPVGQVKEIEKSEEQSPEKSEEKSPEKSDVKTPEKTKDKTPEKSTEKTPEKSKEKTPEKSKEKTPENPDELTTVKSEEKCAEKLEVKELDKPEKKAEKAEKTDKAEKSDKEESKPSPKKKEKPDGKENGPYETIGDRENFLDHVDIRRDSINRVKLYVLCDQRVWEDRGTGHVMCINSVDNDSPSNCSRYVIIVRLEGHSKNVLESRVLMDTVYQKQQETLIVWSETDVMDLALSFQEKNGCEELWNKICEVQGRDPGDGEGGFDDGEDSDVGELTTSSSRLALPPIEIGRLSEIDALVHMHLSTTTTREKMANAIENENVIAKLCDVFHLCEDIEHTEGLRTFYSIAKNLFMLNRTSMIEILLDDKHVKDLIGMFEFDPAYKNPLKHREFVYDKATFQEVLHISNPELKEKIHRLYRAQYIQDACLPSLGLFEENLLSTLSTHIFFSRVDIVAMLQKDKKAMRELFGQLKSRETSPSRRRDLAKFLKEMIQLSQNLPATGGQSKDNFFKNMLNNDILEGIEPCMRVAEADTRSTMVEVLKSLVEHNPQTIRDFLLKQSRDQEDEDVLLNRLIVHMLTDDDPHLTSGTEVILIMKTLLDPDSMTGVKSERSEFLQLFYHRCIHTLLKPLLENVDGRDLKKDDFITANRACVMIRLLSFCIEHHSFSMRQHCISTDLLNKMLVLLKSKHKFVSLYALKLLHRVVSVKDDYYIRYIVRERVLDSVFSCFKQNGTRYNVINSAILHLCDYIRMEDVRPLIKYIVENHSDVADEVSYVKVFKEIKLRYEQHRDREETMSIRSEDNSLASPRSFKKDRHEDQWFEEDDDNAEVGTLLESIEKDIVAVPAKKEEVTARKTGIEPMFPSLLKRKNAFDDDDAAVFGGGAAPVLNHADKKIVIKMSTEKSPSRTPSPATSPRASPGPSREDEVTSSQNNSKESTPSPCPSPAPTVKSLVDYDESDSDEEVASPDAVPSSSTGSPEAEKEKQVESKKSSDSPEYSDVSSTSGEEKEDKEEKETNIDVIEANRKRTSDGLDPIDAKRSRIDTAVSEA